MNKNTVLIVMPIYNAEETLALAIESILAQRYQEIHLVLVDDCSTDGSLDIAQKYQKLDPRVSVIKNSTNKGAYYSRNVGLYKNRNKPWGYFSTHDADDVSFPHRLELIIKQFNNPKVTAVQDTFERKSLRTGKTIESSLTLAHAVFKRNIFEELGYFEVKRFGADWEHWARVSLYNKEHGLTTRAISHVAGESFVAENNLTVQIPIGSKLREDYIVSSRKAHDQMIKSPGGLYRSFSTNMKADPMPIGKTPKAIEKRPAANMAKQKAAIHNKAKVTVVLLTWQRIGNLKRTLQMLSTQTFSNFNVRISNANIRAQSQVDHYAKFFSDRLDISVSHDGNEIYAFRRLTVGKSLAQNGTDIILFIDDDITFDDNYVEHCLRNYESKSYKSGFAWSFQKGGQDYYSLRTRIRDYSSKVNYCGTGISIIDAKAFLSPELFHNIPEEAYMVEDLWLSYCIQHRLRWKLGYIEMNNASIGGADSVALYKKIIADKKSGKAPDKADLLRKLVAKPYGWKL